MSDGTYSAGTIFLQVVPVFHDAMRKIERQAEDINNALGKKLEQGGKDAGQRAGDAMGEELEKSAEKSGKKAGEKFSGEFNKLATRGLAEAQRNLKSLKLHLEDKEVREEAAALSAQLNAIFSKKGKIKVKLDDKEAYTQLTALSAGLKGLRDSAAHNQLKVDADQAMRAIDMVIARVEKSNPKLKVKVEEPHMGGWETKMKAALARAAKGMDEKLNPALAAIKAKMEALGDLKVGVDIDEESFQRGFLKIEAELAHMAEQDISIGVDADILAALGELEAVQVEIDKLDRDDVNIDVNLRGFARLMAELRAVRAGEKSLTQDSLATANSFRAFSFIVLGVVSILPALVPLLAAVGGALLALGPIVAGVGAGFGTMILGFSGIQNAVQALLKHDQMGAKEAAAASKQQETSIRGVIDAKRSLSRAIEDAARSEADAARAVADAERSAAQSIQSALRQRADAERNLASAQRDATQAQQDLREARRLAQQDLTDAANSRSQNALDIRQGVIDVFNATVQNNAVQADGSSSNLEKEQASIQLAQAKLRLKELRETQKQLNAEKKKTDKLGIDGTDRVEQAQDALTAALERQKEATRALGDADRAVNRARVDGARQVADAVRNQRRAQEDAARSVGDAQRNLRRAQEDYQASLKQTAEVGSTSMYNLQVAMAALSPAGREFARYLFSLRKGFYAIRAAAQEQMLPGVQAAMETVINKYGPGFKRFITTMAATLGDLFRETGRVLTNPTMQQFFQMMAELGPRFMRQFGKSALAWMQVFARLLTIAAPFATKFSDAMLAMSENALAFVKSKKGTKVIQDFLAYAAEVGPKVWEFFKNLFGAVVNLGVALAPLGEVVLDILDAFLGWIKNMDPKVLAILVGALLGAIFAFQILNGAIALTMTMLTLMEAGIAVGFISTVVVFVGALLLIGAIFALLYAKVDWFRAGVKAILKAIGIAFKFLWQRVLVPVFDGIVAGFKALGRGMRWVWEHVIHPVVKGLWTAIKWAWKVIEPVLTLIFKAWRALAHGFQWAYKNILWPVLDLLITAIAKTLWLLVIKPVFWAIRQAWKFVADTFKEGWKKAIKPTFEAFGDAIGWLGEKVRAGVDKIGSLWDSLKEKMSKPIRTVIEFVNKYLIGGFNKIAGFVGSDKMKELPIPTFAKEPRPMAANPGGLNAQSKNALATGGILPGYTPGRDVHHFVSPTGGRLHLSGGEAIMRPEIVSALGPGWVHSMNALARRGGAAAVRRAMMSQAFAGGGVYWPVPGHQTGTYPGHDGVDINRGSGWDDFGDPIRAYRSGRIVYTGYGHGYGQAIFEKVDGGPTVVYGHTSGLAVRAGQRVAGGQLIGYVGNTGNSSAPHLHFGIPGGTTALALGLLAGGDAGGPGVWGHLGNAFKGITGWAKKALGAPVEWLRDRISGAFDKLGDTPMGELLVSVGGKMVDGLGHFLKGDSSESTMGGEQDQRYATGGIYDGGTGGLADNGTMMYDNGGYLPPGLTTVVNLTGKPEPVFTADQFAGIAAGGIGGEGGGIHYEPHFEGSDLTAADVADDLNFAFRQLGKRGKYAGSR